MEKFIGLLLIVIGALTFYATYTSLGIGSHSVFFLTGGLVLAVLGFFLLIAKTE